MPEKGPRPRGGSHRRAMPHGQHGRNGFHGGRFAYNFNDRRGWGHRRCDLHVAGPEIPVADVVQS